MIMIILIFCIAININVGNAFISMIVRVLWAWLHYVFGNRSVVCVFQCTECIPYRNTKIQGKRGELFHETTLESTNTYLNVLKSNVTGQTKKKTVFK